jgi:hypothetical protein
VAVVGLRCDVDGSLPHRSEDSWVGVPCYEHSYRHFRQFWEEKVAVFFLKIVRFIFHKN